MNCDAQNQVILDESSPGLVASPSSFDTGANVRHVSVSPPSTINTWPVV